MVDTLEGWFKTVFKVSILNDQVNEIDNNRDGRIERKLYEWRGWVVSEEGGESRWYETLLQCENF